MRASVLSSLLAQDAVSETQGTLILNLETPVNTETDIAPPVGIRGRPAKRPLASQKTIKKI